MGDLRERAETSLQMLLRLAREGVVSPDEVLAVEKRDHEETALIWAGINEAKATVTAALTTQTFFSTMAAEARRPHFGDQAKEWTRSLLLRAEEAGLYHPETK